MSAPGWYPDPSDPSRQRYFDGKAWTENYAPFGAPTPGIRQPAKPGKQQWNWKWIAGVGAAAVVLIAIAILGFPALMEWSRSAPSSDSSKNPRSKYSACSIFC